MNAVEKKKFLDASYISQLQSHCNYQKAEQNFNFTKILMHEKSFSGIEVRIHGVLDFSSDIPYDCRSGPELQEQVP